MKTKTEFEVYKCGTEVKAKGLQADPIITCVSIRFGAIQYELSYFYNGKEETVWMREEQFEASNRAEKEKFGYKQSKS